MSATPENKVQFNFKNVHYAKITPGEKGAVTFATPVPIPGGVTMNLAQVGEMKKFYADGVCFWQGSTNSGYEGDMEIARIPESMLTDIWGMAKKPTDNVIIENINDKQSDFALLFEIDGDQSEQLYCMYNCSASRPNIEAETNKEGKEPKPQKLHFSSVPLANGDVKACTAADTPDNVRTGWFQKVYQARADAA